MSPLAVLLGALAAARREGVAFENAWPVASERALGVACDPSDWQPVLAATVEAWRAGYERWPQTGCERALTLLDFNSEPTDLDQFRAARPAGTAGVCRRCGSPVPVARARRGAAFCKPQCRMAWHSAKARGQIAA